MKDYSVPYNPSCFEQTEISPLVSVRLLAYNQVDEIDACIEGALGQKTAFPFEIVIGEDGSSDGTREKCMVWADRYPQIIRLYLRDRRNNIRIDGRPSSRFNFIQTLKACKGKYIAYLDGDDRWTTPDKLQRQVDFFEQHPGYILHCGHARMISADSREVLTVHDQSFSGDLHLADFTENCPVVSSTAMFRNECLDRWPPQIYQTHSGDWILWVHLLQSSGLKGFYSAEILAEYNHQSPGVFSSITETERLLYYSKHLRLISQVFKNREFRRQSFQKSNWYYTEFLRAKLKSGDKSGYLFDVLMNASKLGGIRHVRTMLSEYKRYSGILLLLNTGFP